MRPTRAFGLGILLVLASCATNPLCIPPPPHALPKWRSPAERPDVPESRPAAVSEGFDPAAAPDDQWREGDSVAVALEFEDGATRETFWLLLEVIQGPVLRDDGSERAVVRTTLLDDEGTEIGTSRRRIDPDRIESSGAELFAAYSGIVAAAATGESPESIQERIEEEMGEGSAVYDALRDTYRELRRTAAPRFVRNRLKEVAINSSIGSISIVDMAMAALMPVEVLVDVNRLNEEQAALAEFTDIPVQPIRIPYVLSVGGNIHLRFAATLAPPVPPYVLTGGLIELAGVNETRGDRSFLVRVVSAKRGDPEAPASRPESRAATRSEEDAAR